MADPTRRLVAALRVRQLDLIATLVDLGTMRAAAERMSITTAAISKGLREVESLFEVPLFHRLPRGLVPTAAGKAVAQRARILLDQVTQLGDDLRHRRFEDADLLRLGAPPFITWTWLPRILAALRAQDQLPPLSIVEGRLDDICAQLEAGEIDVLTTMSTPSELGGLSTEGFVIEQIGTEKWCVVSSPAHRLASRPRDTPFSWGELRNEHWILPPRPTHARMMVEQTLLDQGELPLVPHIESTSAITNVHLAEQVLGLTMQARAVVADRLARGTLVELPVRPLPEPVPIALVYRLGAARQAKIAAFRRAAAVASLIHAGKGEAGD